MVTDNMNKDASLKRSLIIKRHDEEEDQELTIRESFDSQHHDDTKSVGIISKHTHYEMTRHVEGKRVEEDSQAD